MKVHLRFNILSIFGYNNNLVKIFISNKETEVHKSSIIIPQIWNIIKIFIYTAS
jgi:hypothetical protein